MGDFGCADASVTWYARVLPVLCVSADVGRSMVIDGTSAAGMSMRFAADRLGSNRENSALYPPLSVGLLVPSCRWGSRLSSPASRSRSTRSSVVSCVASTSICRCRTSRTMACASARPYRQFTVITRRERAVRGSVAAPEDVSRTVSRVWVGAQYGHRRATDATAVSMNATSGVHAWTHADIAASANDGTHNSGISAIRYGIGI